MGQNEVLRIFGLDYIPYFIVLLIPMTLAVDHLSLKVTNFSSSYAEYDCQYHGNEKNISFQVMYNEYVCLSQNNVGQCKSSKKNGCRIKCKESHQLNVVSFRVDLISACENDLAYRCTARNMKLITPLRLKSWFKIDGISDPPKILINNGKSVELDGIPAPIPIGCTVTNACYGRNVEISGDVRLTPMTFCVADRRKGTHTAIVRTTALFDEVGNYTITCKDAGLEAQFAKNFTVVVQEKKVDGLCKDKLNGKISINEEKSIELDGKPVPVVCTFTDMCKKIDIEMSGNIHIMMPLIVSHHNTARGYRTIAKTTALFVKAGSYTVFCGEAGKKNDVTNITLEIGGHDLTPCSHYGMNIYIGVILAVGAVCTCGNGVIVGRDH